MNQTVAPSPFRFLPLARLAQGGRWRTEAMRSYGAPVLYWFTRGQGRITINGVTAGYGPHNAVFLPSGTMHGFEMNAHVHGNVLVFPAGIEEIGLPEEPVHLRLREADQHAELNRLLDNIQREIGATGPEGRQALMCHAGLLAVWLTRETSKTEEEPGEKLDAAGRLVAAYTALVEKDFHSSKTVRDYAAALGITPTHLSRACNKACGRPASAIHLAASPDRIPPRQQNTWQRAWASANARQSSMRASRTAPLTRRCPSATASSWPRRL